MADRKIFPKLREMVREIVKDASTRQGEVRTGLSHQTIKNLMDGYRGYKSTLRSFARGYGVPLNPLLEAAGFPPENEEPTPTTAIGEESNVEATVPEGVTVEIALRVGMTVRLEATSRLSRPIELSKSLLRAWLAVAELQHLGE